MPAFNGFLLQLPLTDASLNPFGHPSSGSQTPVPHGQRVHQALAGVAAPACSQISSSNTQDVLFKAMQSLWPGHWIQYNEGERGWCVHVREEGSAVPWPPRGDFSQREMVLAQGDTGKRGSREGRSCRCRRDRKPIARFPKCTSSPFLFPGVGPRYLFF